MKVYRASRVLLTTVVIVGLTATGISLIAAIAGLTSPAVMTLVALSVAVIILLASIVYFAASQVVWKRSINSNEREHFT